MKKYKKTIHRTINKIFFKLAKKMHNHENKWDHKIPMLLIVDGCTHTLWYFLEIGTQTQKKQQIFFSFFLNT